ncbi:MAG: hypothetical protein PHT76_12820 [Anaerostipes sp.]|nr:hypothetical protein [Anaerostipes sp.]
MDNSKNEVLEKMKNVDVRTVDKNTLVDIETVAIDTTLPEQERMKQFLEQVKNPYCYMSHGIVVKVSFAGKDTLSDCLARCLSF